MLLKNFFPRIVVGLCLLSASLFAVPEAIAINKQTNDVSVVADAHYYIDETETLAIESIMKMHGQFQPMQKKKGNFGYRLHDAVWVSFSLSNEEENAVEKLLVYSNSYTDVVNLYLPQDDGITEIKSGILNKEIFDNTLSFRFPLRLEAHETRTYYLKLEAKTGSLVFDLLLQDQETFYSAEIVNQIILFLFFGGMLAIFIYNASLYIISKNRLYLYYLFFIAATSLHHLSLTGGIFYLLPFENKAIIAGEAYLTLYYAVLVEISIILFTRQFLETWRYKNLDFALRMAIYLSLMIAVLNLQGRYLLDIAIYYGALIVVMMEITGIYIWIKGHERAKYYVMAWTVSLSGFLAGILHHSGVNDFFGFSIPHYLELTVLTEALMFSIVLASQFKLLSREKELANARLLAYQQEQTRVLEKEVASRTQDLQHALHEKEVLLKEVHHRVKNNLQIVVSLLRLQSDEIDDERIQQIMLDSENRIKAMGSVHEMLYSQESLTSVNAQRYFERLVGEISSVYESVEDVFVEITAEVELTMERAIYCGLIINELVTNAYKYAFDEEGGEIEIDFHLEGDRHYLCVCDNGMGAVSFESGNSLGMLLVRTLVERQLRGDIESYVENGTRHVIRFAQEA